MKRGTGKRVSRKAKASQGDAPAHLPPEGVPEAVLANTNTEERLNITDFLTDGSLAALCDELSNMTGVEIRLHDRSGRRIVTTTEEDPAPWRIVDAPDGPAPRIVAPLVVAGLEIGTIRAAEGEPRTSDRAREYLDNAVQLLALASSELCNNELELAHRIKEVTALTRMSGLLTRATSPEKVLEAVLDSALDVLDLDAGSVMLLRTGAGVTSVTEEDMSLHVSRNLSEAWLKNPSPLSKDRIFDRIALSGEIVAVEDLWADSRVYLDEEVRAEGLRGALHAGLVFKGRPIGVIRLYSRTPRPFEQPEKRLLQSLAAQAAISVEQARLLRVEQEEARVQRQLQLAADVQRRMLPKGAPSVPRLDVAARYVPSFELGGDFYDLIELNGHLGVTVGDVVGKGVAAALFMSSVRASLRAHAQDVYDLDEVLRRVNKAMCRDSELAEFASVWYGVIDPARLRITYCSAGHEPPLIVRVPGHRPPSTADIDELSVGGMVVGIDPSQRYQRAVYDLNPRDVLFAFTDGMTDARSPEGQRFGKKRLRDAILETLEKHPEGPANEIADGVLRAVSRFEGSAARADDRTLVVVRVK